MVAQQLRLYLNKGWSVARNRTGKLSQIAQGWCGQRGWSRCRRGLMSLLGQIVAVGRGLMQAEAFFLACADGANEVTAAQLAQ